MRFKIISVVLLLGLSLAFISACSSPTCWETESYSCQQTYEYSCYKTEYRTEQVAYYDTVQQPLTDETWGFQTQNGVNIILGCYAGQELSMRNTDSVGGTFTVRFYCSYGGKSLYIDDSYYIDAWGTHKFTAQFDIACDEPWTYSSPKVFAPTKAVQVLKYRTEQVPYQVATTCTGTKTGTCERQIQVPCK
jgi:hypothetical protein